MPAELASPVLRNINDRLSAIPITSGMLGRRIGETRSVLHIVEERQARRIGGYTIKQACFELFIHYFDFREGHPKPNHDLDQTGKYAHLSAVIGGDYAAEQGLDHTDAWAIRERADRTYERGDARDIVRHLADDRFRDPSTWPNPIIDLSNDQAQRIFES